MPAIDVRFYDGATARRHAARLDVANGQWVVDGDFGRRTGSVAELSVSEPTGGAPRLLAWPDGACCEIADRDGLDRLLELAGHHNSPVVGIQRHWPWAIAALIGLVAALVFAYLQLLPWVAGRVAPAIPPAVSAAISRQVLEALDAHVLTPTKLAPDRQDAIARRLADLGARFPELPAYRLHFRAAQGLGPNALALPSGDVVILDALVNIAGNDDEIVGVLAHELGHVAHRHGLRQLIQSTVVSFVAGLWFGDVSSLAASLSALVLESRYSRQFEFEADNYGGRALLAAGISPEALARMLERLSAAQAARRGGNGGDARGGVFESHPETAARIAALRALRRQD